MTRPDDRLLVTILGRRGRVERTLSSYGVRGSEAEEIADEILWDMYQAAKRDRLDWQNTGRLSAFVWTICRRRAAQWHHEQHARGERVEVSDDIGEAPSPEARTEARETLARLQGGTTAPRWRVLMAYVDGDPVPEIAKREGIPVTTTWNRIQLARRDLKRALARDSRKH